MPITFQSDEYLNTGEAIDFVTGGSQFIFAQLRKRVRIEEHRFLGKGRSKYFKRTDLEELKKMMGPYPVEK